MAPKTELCVAASIKQECLQMVKACIIVQRSWQHIPHSTTHSHSLSKLYRKHIQTVAEDMSFRAALVWTAC